ncbi:hypothetical protein Gotur_025044 [Gossypium turneri]
MDSLCENSLCQEASVGNSSMEDITSKKVHFRDKSDKVGKDMLVDSTAELVLSWKDKLLGQLSKANRSGLEKGEDFDLVEWDIQKTIVNGLSGYMYKCKIVVEIGRVIGRVAKLDMNTDNKDAYLHKSTNPSTRKETSTFGSSSVSKNMAIDRTREKSESFGP